MESPRIWSKRRQVLGNMLPLLSVCPWLLIATIFARQNLESWILFITFLIADLWLLTNFVGLFQNAKIEQEVRALYPISQGIFVGYAGPEHPAPAIDPHADVGLLTLGKTLKYEGEATCFEIFPTEVTRVFFKLNAHSLMLLGGYAAIETQAGVYGFEVRTAPTLWANLRKTKWLLGQLQAWSRP